MASTDLQPLKLNILTEFSRKQKHFLDEWTDKAMSSFLDWTKKYSEDMYQGSLKLVQENKQLNQEEMKVIEALYRSYAQAKGQVKHGQSSAYSKARLFYYKNIRKRFFHLLKNECKYEHYLKNMKRFCQGYSQARTPSLIFFRWKKSTRTNLRLEIQTQVNRRTDTEIQKMQREYEALIAQLEGVLEKKLIELKVEEEQHRELLHRYEGLSDRRQVAMQQTKR